MVSRTWKADTMSNESPWKWPGWKKKKITKWRSTNILGLEVGATFQ
jgi:hypothetical protein